MPTQISRRALLTGGVGACTALAARFACGAPLVGEKQQQNDPKKLRVAAIGVGNRGRDNLIELASEEVVALCDVDADYLQAAARKHPDSVLYQDYRQLLESEELDAVVISTPDHSHAGPAVLAMRRGCHVYCEKPLAHNLYETELMSRVAREQGLATQMANQHRASAGYRRARQLLEAGVIGDVQSIHAWTLRPYWPQGIQRPNDQQPVPANVNWDLWLGPAATRPYHSAYHPLRWRGWWDFGAGALGDMGTHLLAPVLTALELYIPERIEAESSAVNEETLPAWSIIHFLFPATAQRAALQVIWYDGGKQPPREITGADRLPDEGVLVIGERGKLFIPPLGKPPRLVPATLEQHAPPIQDELPSSHIGQWLAACKASTPDECDTPFADGARLTNICLMGKLALRIGKPIQWDIQKNLPVDCEECQQWLTREYRDGWQLS